MLIKSPLYEEIEFDEKDIIVLERGLIGLPHLRRFVVVDFVDDAALHWLQSIDDPEYGFMVSDPNLFESEYTVTIDTDTRRSLKIDDGDEIVVMTIVTVRDKGDRITGNLLGPIAVNATKRIGSQLVLDPNVYGTEAPLAFPKNAERPEKTTAGASV